MAEKKIQADGGAEPHPVIDAEVCKGCGRCIAACPPKVLRLRAGINHRNVQPAEYTGSGCKGCGVCFYNCPEPYAIEVEIPHKPASKR